jgi:DNA replication and repair protein RecF
VLVLDDVLSELDNARGTALLSHLPAGQVVITTAGVIPAAAAPERIVRIVAGTVSAGDDAATTAVAGERAP